MFQRRLLTLGIPVHQAIGQGGRRDLISDVPDDTQRCHRPIGQEGPQEPEGPHLHREPNPILITAPQLHPSPVGII